MNTAVVEQAARPPQPIVPRPAPRDVIYLSPESLAKEIKRVLCYPITEKTLANWRSGGKGPAFVKVGRGVRYSLRDVTRWIDAQKRFHTPALQAEQQS